MLHDEATNGYGLARGPEVMNVRIYLGCLTSITGLIYDFK